MRLRTGIATVVSVFSLAFVGLGLAGSGLTSESGTNRSNVATASFHRLGDLPGGAFLSEANAVSAGGSFVVGKSASSSGEEAFRWTAAEGMVALGVPGGAAGSTAIDVSADGAVVIGTASYVAFRWTSATGAVELPFWGFPSEDATPAVSADGSVVVGSQCFWIFGTQYCQAYRWTPEEGMVAIGDPLLGFISIATGVSADGSVVVGTVGVSGSYCDCTASGACSYVYGPFRWTADEGITGLGFAPTGCSGDAAGEVSADGRVLLIGSWEEPLGGAYWTAGSGLVLLPDLPGGPVRTRARALSGDGSVIVGNSWSASGEEAFVWDAVNGMRSLRDLLSGQYGLALAGWTLISANGVSDDGQTIVGTGVNPDGHTEAWIATIPGVDSDGDGVIDYTDACDHSNVDATLSISGCDTGIANDHDAAGCTLADALATACPVSITSKARGRFAACVARLAGDWRAAGRIDRDQEGRAVACAAGGRAGTRPRTGRLPIPVVVATPGAAAAPEAGASRGIIPGGDPAGGDTTPSAPSAEGEPVTLTDGSELWFVEMPSPPTTDGGDLASLENDLDAFRAAAVSAGLHYRERRVFTTLWNGVSIALRPEDRGKLTRLAGIASLVPVRAVTVPEPHDGVDPALLTSLAMIGADVAQNDLGLTGAGVKVGIIDTGIDYDHPDLGGDGVARANSDRFPNARIVAGYDFVGDAYVGNNEPAPDLFPDDCYGHGTHVAGIVGANGGVLGVAPAVQLGAYRVFGCTGFVAADIVVAALERALADGMQVVNMSLGTGGQWPQDPMAAASDRLVNAGVVVVAAGGNEAANGLYWGSAPAVGKKVISVASFDNTHINLSSFRLSPDQRLVGYLSGPPLSPPLAGAFPLGRTGTRFSTADACAPLPPGSQTGRVVIIRRGTCPYETKAFNAHVAGALFAIIYNNVAGFPDPPGPGFPGMSTIPVIGITKADGDLMDTRLSSGPVTLTWEDDIASFVNATGASISPFSSYGPSPDLTLKPDVGAPGGFVRSTIPIEEGIYANFSGTSMATPHVAGTVALLLEARPHTPANAVRDILQNNAVPRPSQGVPGLLEAVHRQGAGMINVPATVTATTRITPGALSLGEIEAGAAARTIVISNDSGSPINYQLSHRPAVSTSPSTFVPIISSATAVVGFEPNPVIVPAGGSASVVVTVTPPQSLPDRGLFGGFVVLLPDTGGPESRVPYFGLKGDYQSIPALTSTPQGSPALARRGANGALVRLPSGGTFSMVGSDHPLVFYHLDHPVSELKFEVFEADTGRSWHWIDRRKGVRRNTGATAEFLLDWDGETVFGKQTLTAPNGRYVIRLSVLRALADPQAPQGWETWTSPAFSLARPAPSEPGGASVAPVMTSVRSAAKAPESVDWQSCGAAFSEYLAALDEARTCNVNEHHAQCTVSVSDSLACPCTTFINPRNHAAFARMQAAAEAWGVAGCGAEIECGAGLCVNIRGSACTETSETGPPGPPWGACQNTY